MGTEGIIAEHPTLKLKYMDPEMARLTLELKEQMQRERESQSKKELAEGHSNGATETPEGTYHIDHRHVTGTKSTELP